MIEKIYNPKQIEESIYKFWEESGYFEPDITDFEKPRYCIMMPPPNITGALHLGHAFQQTIMDILARYNRMNGKNVLWRIGLDHAGIAAQILIENKIFNQTKTPKNNDLKNSLLKEIWSWKEQTEKLINYQIKRLGNSVSWTNTRFTMDPQMSFAVKEAFIRLYQDNLIYKGKRLVNWDYKIQTAISDLEVSYKQVKGLMWYIRYKLEEYSKSNNHTISTNKNIYITVATTKPETMFGDVAIAVNPEDSRYKKLIGKYVLIPLINRKIPIISDEHINPNKGTGCVKITPAHDFNDYMIGKKHKLCMINIFSTYRKILEKPEIFCSQSQFYDKKNCYIPTIFRNLNCDQARTMITSTCNQLNLIEQIQHYDVTIAYNNRTGTIVEPMLTNQWYLKTTYLAKQAKNIVEKGSIEFIPEQYKNIYFKWMDNIQDWCISRQIWWGHQIPAWYDNTNKIYVGHCEKDIRKNYKLHHDTKLRQDHDVLDTWFSSSLWTFSNLGWPKNNNLLKFYHPTDIIVSGFDIIFFWISRMIMMTMYFIKDDKKNCQIPFKKIYITGLVRDKFGQKMSKSKNNVINPIDIIDRISIHTLSKNHINNNYDSSQTIKKPPYNKNTPKKNCVNEIITYGADSLRMTLAALSSYGRDIHWDINRLIGYHNFCNKLWNVSKFILLHTTNQDCGINYQQDKLLFSLPDRWITSKLHQTIQIFYQELHKYRFDKIINLLYEFIWHQFCDWYIEFIKPTLYCSTNTQKLIGTRYTLITSFETLLRLSHPIIPFITEKIWQKIKLIIKIKEKTIMLQSFPKYNISDINLNVIIEFEWIKDLISEIRTFRTQTGILYKTPLHIALQHISSRIKKYILENNRTLLQVAQLKKIDFLKDNDTFSQKSFNIPLHESELIVFIPDVFNKQIAIDKLHKEIKLITQKINYIQKKIDHQNEYLKVNCIKEQEKLIFYTKTKNKLHNHLSIIISL
ncbi:valyl-tRNA synthetase [Candidatus Blochmanniella vafra str. BVAF]|uniref:Valine--tRNA ligase n=1 Tax=Blochmanniella vafra (strain BVAF) TaxID=859654 RepID=E8Q6K5_BLOVB|nr:valine--tRNA ligase [Candidatus Blochmannia vafer]ADV33446.1 valyl-tRNA synthetase [Candidatus Blochmannia vafer str. BVAF]